MSDNADSHEPALHNLIADVLAAARAQREPEFSNGLRDALNALVEHPQRLEGRQAFARRISSLDAPIGAGFLAVWLGAGVEAGVDPEPTTRPILDALLKWSRTLQVSAEGGEEEFSAPDSETLQGMQLLGQGLVAHLSRSENQRTEIQQQTEIIAELERVEHISNGALWVSEMLRKRSGTLLVIHVNSRKAVFVSYNNISNCFHLFTLLQAALAGRVPGTKRVDPKVLSAATGEHAVQATDSSWWHYGIGTVPEADLLASVWGEASPDSIPVIDGRQVLLLWPMVMESRSWDSGFFGPFLMASPPSVEVQGEVPDEELDAWWLKLHLPEPVAKPRWKFWQK